MNLQQLRYVCTLARSGFSVSRSAVLLHTSQPAVSQQIRALERELGLQLFVRDRHRLVGLTADGERILAHAEAALSEIGHIRGLARYEASGAPGQLVIATTHLQARYVLPAVLNAFSKRHPNVELALRHGNAAEVAQALSTGTAHLGVIQITPQALPDIVMLEAFRSERVLVVPRHHPLVQQGPLTLQAIAEHPLVTYELSSGARRQVFQVFEEAGVATRVILSALDADVIKACVARGLGVAILPTVALVAGDDQELHGIPAGHLFPPSVTGVAVHRHHEISRYAWDLIELFAPRWRRTDVERLRGACEVR